jgi:hypothetical protein
MRLNGCIQKNALYVPDLGVGFPYRHGPYTKRLKAMPMERRSPWAMSVWIVSA